MPLPPLRPDPRFAAMPSPAALAACRAAYFDLRENRIWRRGFAPVNSDSHPENDQQVRLLYPIAPSPPPLQQRWRLPSRLGLLTEVMRFSCLDVLQVPWQGGFRAIWQQAERPAPSGWVDKGVN